MNATVEEVWAALEDLADPEIPVISLRDLGILREVRAGADGLEVVITPDLQRLPGDGPDRGRRAVDAEKAPEFRPASSPSWPPRGPPTG